MLESNYKYYNMLFEGIIYLKANGPWICERNEIAEKKIKELSLPTEWQKLLIT
jgi:hypothetical protein